VGCNTPDLIGPPRGVVNAARACGGIVQPSPTSEPTSSERTRDP
jgi:hypothetical protein